LPYCAAVVWQSLRRSWLAARRRVESSLIVCAVLVATLSLSPARVARAADSDVRVNSIGYVTGRAKRFSIVGGSAASFVVRRAADDSATLTGSVAGQYPDANGSGDSVAIGDFSALNDAGSYYVDVAGVGRSTVFSSGTTSTRRRSSPRCWVSTAHAAEPRSRSLTRARRSRTASVTWATATSTTSGRPAPRAMERAAGTMPVTTASTR
jgi:hypothetical protein